MTGDKSNYKILSLVGQGQFGRVFAAIERKSGELVALKELQTKQLPTSSFLRELTFLVTLDHFNLVTCKALEHGDNKRYLVMDYCEGGTLRSLLNNSPSITLGQSLKLIIDVLHGLEYAHDQGIIHRDIKPENILLKFSDRNYTAHIADFGIAKLSQEIDAQDVLGNTGSPAYMAPEQFYGEYSYNCDLYGLGIILYELVTGERPFSGMPKDLLTAHLSQPVRIDPQIPILLRAAIAKSLEKLPQHRFQTATEMLDSLELIQAILESDPTLPTTVAAQADFATLVSLTQFSLNYQVSHLEIIAEQVYLGTGDHLIIQRYQDASLVGEVLEDRQIPLDEPIQGLQFSATGCLVTTKSSLYYLSQALGIEANLLPIATFLTEKLVPAVDPQGSWLGVSFLPKQSTETKFKIYQLPSCKLQRSLIDFPANNFLIALDSRRILGINQNQAQNTEFQLFDRRGNKLANFTVQIQLETVIYNPLIPHRLLGTEINNPGVVVLITLEKFNLQRIEIEIKTTLIKSCPQGYLLSDRQGRMIMLNHFGDCIARFKIPLLTDFMVTAIATSPSRLLVASASSSHSQLDVFDWNQAGI